MEQTFNQYLKEQRKEFVNAVNKERETIPLSIPFRTAIDDLMIAYDQAVEAVNKKPKPIFCMGAGQLISTPKDHAELMMNLKQTIGDSYHVLIYKSEDIEFFCGNQEIVGVEGEDLLRRLNELADKLKEKGEIK